MTFPNILSLFRILLSPVFLILFLREDNFSKDISFLIFFVAVLTDWYDGWYARKYKRVSKLGVFLDPLADKILTSFAFTLFYVLGIMPFWMLAIIIFRDIAITLLRSYDEYKGHSLKTSFIAKIKTFIQMTYIFFVLFLLLISSHYHNLYDRINSFLYSSVYNYILLLIVTFLTFISGILYFKERHS